PVETENYVHRIGRTARAGKTGKAITLASEQDVYELPDIEKYIGKKIPAQMASEELYREDKSEGMRIHTDSYDDRHTNRLAGRGKPHRDSRNGSKRGQSFKENSRSAHSRKSPQKYSEDDNPRRKKPGNIQGKNRESAENPRSEARLNLSKLSLEERMAYYKQKYDSPKQEKAETPTRSGRSQKGQSRNFSHSRQKEGSRKKSSSKSSVPAQSSVPKKDPAFSSKPQGPEQKKAAPSGIVSRFLGIFKRKS
ncbi:MAG: RNA helicase, partial [Spirochaetaceae bacterium]|nr:RNA helicase [Spirochaetaceae bacterium]